MGFKSQTQHPMLPQSIFIISIILIVNQPEQKQVECDDDGSYHDPEDGMQTAKFVASSMHLKDVAFMSRSLTNLSNNR